MRRSFEAMGKVPIQIKYGYSLSHARESVPSCRPRVDAPGVFCGDVSLGSAELERACLGDPEPQPIVRQYGYIHLSCQMCQNACYVRV